MTDKKDTLETVRGITIAGITYNFKDDYTMTDVEKLATVEEKHTKGECNKMEVAYVGIFQLLETVFGEDGQEMTLNYNQIREIFRSMKAGDFNKLATKMAGVTADSDDKKKD